MRCTTVELYRAQALLERKQHETLQALAAAEGRSMSEIIREAMAKYLVERDEERHLKVRLRWPIASAIPRPTRRSTWPWPRARTRRCGRPTAAWPTPPATPV